ncbi:hypothetical protein QVD17_23958 [Tagetes erecta]|uniref:Uncharacterized protein n=1 Tax=Tagetes erecta TaxID=13708 RepID=A0AAD8KJN0_TARER|nr:hypothetical protein QVD17_23958 [Tagetes erecta]
MSPSRFQTNNLLYSFGEGYETRSDEEGFRGISGRNQSLSHDEDKIIHGNCPASWKRGEREGKSSKSDQAILEDIEGEALEDARTNNIADTLAHSVRISSQCRPDWDDFLKREHFDATRLWSGHITKSERMSRV